jgi:hypothetical protein
VSYRVPCIKLTRLVSRKEKSCTWCQYPIVEFSAEYKFIIGGTDLGPVFCSDRCAKVEARVTKRSPAYGGFARREK